MLKLILTAVVFCCFVGGLSARSPQQVFRSGVDGVILPVSVRLGNRPVRGLTRADFELRDNGVRQDVREVASEAVPIDLTLLLDLSTSVDGPMLQRLKTAVAETADLLRVDDRIRLVVISQVLREVFPFRAKGQPLPLDTLSAQGATSLYDGLAATMMRPPEASRRQLVVAFTDGRDSTSIIDESALRAIAELSDAVVDIVVPIAAGRSEASRRIAQPRSGVDTLAGAGNVSMNGQGPAASAPVTVPPVLAEIVAPTAGQVFPLPPDGSISRTFKTMLEEFRVTYVLQYIPQGVDPHGWHDIDVRVLKSGKFDIRARKGYRGRATIGAGKE